MNTLTSIQIISFCFAAFGVGYAGGSIVRVARRSIEVLE